MADPSRFNKLGAAGQKSSQTDPYIQTVVIPIVAVPSAADQRTGVFAPVGGCQLISAFISVIVEEDSAVTKEVDAGFTVSGGIVVVPNAILDNVDVSQESINGSLANPTIIMAAGEEFTYTLAGADFVQFKGELVVTYIGTDRPF